MQFNWMCLHDPDVQVDGVFSALLIVYFKFLHELRSFKFNEPKIKI